MGPHDPFSNFDRRTTDTPQVDAVGQPTSAPVSTKSHVRTGAMSPALTLGLGFALGAGLGVFGAFFGIPKMLLVGGCGLLGAAGLVTTQWLISGPYIVRRFLNVLAERDVAE